ncbi:hypothetical protein C6P40_002886 [Pichia californica]|uniref:GIY-YIG domain-containing protein n=1 Tax=Pichia californica TaxID=460514 RepID=A0A9P7BEH1_9ASCO|nr:hypothetical protein C6P40_002886 [[Candida] californica]
MATGFMGTSSSPKLLYNININSRSKSKNVFNDKHNNLANNSVVNNIREELKNKSGIYIIINKINRKYYVGSAHTNNLYIRFRNHLISSGKKGSILIKPDLKLYGREGFIYGILEFYPYKVNMENNKDLYALETSYLSLLLPPYNIMLEAGQYFGFKNKNINIKNDKRLINLKEYKLERKVRTDFSLSIEGINNIKKGSNKRIYLSNNMLSNEDIFNNNTKEYLSHYLCVSRKMIQRALNIGYIYIPNIFLPLLNNNHINNNNSIIEFINESELKDYHY